MIIDLSPEGKGPQYLDPSPGLSLEDLLKQNGLYEQCVELRKQEKNYGK
jgi:hypothetical protein